MNATEKTHVLSILTRVNLPGYGYPQAEDYTQACLSRRCDNPLDYPLIVPVLAMELGEYLPGVGSGPPGRLVRYFIDVPESLGFAPGTYDTELV